MTVYSTRWFNSIPAAVVVALGSALLAGSSVAEPAAPTQSPQQTEIEKINIIVAQMQEAVKKAAVRFEMAANKSATERLAELDNVIATVDNSLKVVAEDGELYVNLAKSIKKAEDTQRKYKDKVEI